MEKIEFLKYLYYLLKYLLFLYFCLSKIIVSINVLLEIIIGFISLSRSIHH